jgi:hypothetical protein
LFELGIRLPPSSVGPMSDGCYDVQIAQQFLEAGDCCRLGLGFSLDLQK